MTTAAHGWEIDDDVDTDTDPGPPPPSDKQADFARDLAGEVFGDNAPEFVRKLQEEGRWNRHAIRDVIDELLHARSQMRTRPETRPPEGLHLVDGQVYRVQRSQADRLYTKALDPKSAQWRYTGRAPLQHLSAETVLTVDAAREWGVRFGVCAVCGRVLTNETSVERGIGPVCEGRFP